MQMRRKVFFSEEKSQKTFAFLRARGSHARGREAKVFGCFFSRKQSLSS